MSSSRRKVQPHSPISGLLAQLNISERKFHDALLKAEKLPSKSGINSLSNFSRLLKEEESLDMQDVELIGRFLGTYLKRDGNVISQTMLAEHWIWRNERHGRLQPEANVDIRTPVVRHGLFSKAVRAILYEKPQLVTISAANEKQVGRNGFALSVGQYCALDAPLNVRRALRIVSLAQLNKDRYTTRQVNAVRVAELVCSQLGIALRNAFERQNDLDVERNKQVWLERIVDNIVESLRYLPKPLLLIKDAHGVPDDILGEFVTSLIAGFRHESPLIALVASERPILGTASETNINLDYMSEAETGALLVWKTGVHASQLPSLIELCTELKRELRKPSVTSLLAGAYLLDQLGDAEPWATFPTTESKVFSSNEGEVASIIRKVVGSVGHGRSIRSLQEDRDVFVGAIRSTGATGRALITDSERSLLFRLAIFEGRFSSAAAHACILSVEGQQITPGHEQRFKKRLDRLCLSGLLTCEHLSPPLYFSLESDVKSWLRTWRDPNNDHLPYDKLAHPTKRRYLAYLDREIQEALEHFQRDPYAIDPASRQAFGRLEPEARQIDLLLLEIWSQILSGEEAAEGKGLPAPAIIGDEFEGLSKWDAQIAWVGLFCANFALFWEAANMPDTAIGHIKQAELWLGKLIQHKFGEGGEKSETTRQLRAIRAQLVLSMLCIEVRQGGSGLELDRWNKLLEQAKWDLDGTNYMYGNALHALLDGMIRNRYNCSQGIEQMLDAAKMAIHCTDMNLNSTADDQYLPSIKDGSISSQTKIKEEIAVQSLRISRARQPISRYLAFMVQREIARAQLRAGSLGASVTTDHTLLRAAKMTREPRLLADTLLALTRSSWFQAIEATERPLTSDPLSLLRQFLFQIDAYIADLHIDKTTLQGHYFTMLGIYNFEKGLADLVAQTSHLDHLEDRRTFGEDMFATGLSQVTDAHFRSVYYAFMADAYLRFALHSNDPAGQIEGTSVQNSLSRKQKRQIDRSRPKTLSAAYLVRSLEELLHEVEGGYALSEGMKRLLARIYEHVSTTEIEAAILVRCTTTGDTREEELKGFPYRFLLSRGANEEL